MADQPRIQQPFANIGKPPQPSTVPAGSALSKKSQADLALQGLVGAK